MLPAPLPSRQRARFVSPLACLPNELLGTTFCFLHRHDLASVVRACRAFYTEGQSYLYRFVELSNESPNLQETIALLGTVRVGAFVREVALITTGSRIVPAPTWFPPDVVQHWVGLRRLELSGVPFTTRQDMDLFRRTLETYCRNLQILAYRHDPYLVFPGVEAGMLGGKRGREHTLDFGSANKSAYCLTHITFAGAVAHYLGSAFDTFTTLRFPNLKSLELGTLATHSGSVHHDTTVTSVTSFIVQHNTIEHLSLGKRVPRNGLFFDVDEALISADTLPKLRSFEGCPATLTVFARRGVSSVFLLTALSLFACGENLDDVSAMVRAIRLSPVRVLSSVRDFGIEFPSVVVPSIMADGVHAMSSNAMVRHAMPSNAMLRQRACLDEIAGVFPSVVNYSGTFPAMRSILLKETFGLYPHLETISVPWYTLLVHMEPSGERDYFAPLVGSLPSLNTVVARKPRYTNFKDQVFTFVRNPAGELSKVVREQVRLAGSFSWRP
ncbi:hypothetical protein M413DRAFT_449282 [Hebeloma cylindrosporum]|uniref:F-box domain-containing protein n=1 Tax=Hebeloma cylindrosporum TaxID=76867 RepID=A0A0C2Y5A6_HEBCY|nr:hypothetical protein M413DRAFT_449282 [Hebeloma cylindrosporum h7]